MSLQILNVKKAALLAAKAMQNWVVPKVEDVVDSGAYVCRGFFTKMH